MNQTTKNVIYVLVGLIVIVLIISLVMGKGGTSETATSTATTTNEVAGNTTGGTNTGTTGGNNTPAAPSLENIEVLSTVIGNSLVRVPQTGTDVALSAGGADYTDANGAVGGHIQAGRILGWVKTDTGYDVFTDMSVTKKGQVQDLHYVALFQVLSSTNVRYTSALLVGDRLPVSGITAAPDKSTQVGTTPSPIMNSNVRYIVTISYQDRKNGEPLTATPSVPKTVTAGVKNHVISK